MVEMSFLLSVAITFDPTLTLQTATALVYVSRQGSIRLLLAEKDYQGRIIIFTQEN
ncbi:hypothetical protein [Vibrio parahaemolyticus]|uniref:hypothetical protein n=1 Tax=Vibrio parahaemolyticus TaxID=670 RepID=UPI001C55E88E|nr:hypothetical protein [Vibrio parahaemolyticus]